MKKLITVILFSFSTLPFSLGQTSPNDTIPFTLTEYNNISVPALINGVDSMDLMFHMGASEVFVIKKAVERMKSLKFDKEGAINTWGGETGVRFSSNNSLQIGSLNWDSLGITEDMHSGHLTDGKFGYDLFEDKIIEIDFDKNHLLIYPEISKTIEGFKKFQFERIHGSLFIEGTLKIGDQELNHRFLIHLGYSGSLLLDDEFVQEHKVNKSLKTISENKLKDSAGNTIITKKSILPGFQLGTTTFENIPIGFFEGAIGRQKWSLLGGDILKRFNYIINFSTSSIYLKPNSLQQQPFRDS